MQALGVRIGDARFDHNGSSEGRAGELASGGWIWITISQQRTWGTRLRSLHLVDRTLCMWSLDHGGHWALLTMEAIGSTQAGVPKASCPPPQT